MTDFVVIESPGSKDVVVVEQPPKPDIIVTAQQGEPGADAYQIAVANGFIGDEAQWLASLSGSGSGAGAFYEHQQALASTTWTINHNFGRKASISLFTVGGVVVMGQITNINNNQSVASFATAIAGYAIAT